MGRFSDNIHSRLSGNYKGKEGNIEFSCGNCLNLFTFSYSDIFLNKLDDIEFVPEPICPQCGAKEELIFSDYGQEKIEDLLFQGLIRKR